MMYRAADKIVAILPPLSTWDRSRCPCSSVLTSDSCVRMGMSSTMITWARTAYTQQNIAVCAHGCGILYFSVSPCVSWIARIRAARNNTLSMGAYVTVVHAVSKIFCTPMCALFVNWLLVRTTANTVYMMKYCMLRPTHI